MNVHPSVTLLSIRQRKVRALITPRALLLRRLVLLLHRRHHSMKGDGTGTGIDDRLLSSDLQWMVVSGIKLINFYGQQIQA